MAAQGSYRFLGKVEYASTAAEGMKIARRAEPTPGRLTCGRTSRREATATKLVWRWPSSATTTRTGGSTTRGWSRTTRCPPRRRSCGQPTSGCARASVGSVPTTTSWTSTARSGKSWTASATTSRVTASGEDACESIHQTVAEIQQGKHWEEEGVPCVVRFTLVKAHAHRTAGGGDGGQRIMGNCWADYWASVVVDRGLSKGQEQDMVTLEIRDLVRKRQKEDLASLKQEMEECDAALAAEKAMSEEQVMNE